MTEDPHHYWVPPVTQDEIYSAIERLPTLEREVFQAVQSEGLTYVQAAARFGVSVRRVEQLLIRALTRIRRRIEKGRTRRT